MISTPLLAEAASQVLRSQSPSPHMGLCSVAGRKQFGLSLPEASQEEAITPGAQPAHSSLARVIVRWSHSRESRSARCWPC